MPARSRITKWLLLTIVLALTGGGLLAGLTAHAEGEKEAIARIRASLARGETPSPTGTPAEKGMIAELADRAVGGILAAFNTLLMGVLWIYTSMVGIVLFFLGNVLDYILHVAKFADNEWVKDGWKITRDTLNVVFILSLLAIAFATIAGIEGYGMKQLLPRLIVAALLVNFSLAIGGAFINFSNIAMRTLAGSTATPGSTLSIRLANVTVIKDFFSLDPNITWDKLLPVGPSTPAVVPTSPVKTPNDLKTNQQLQYTLGALIAAIMLTIVTIAIGAVALMLVIRIVALYVLLILSPVGFVFSILPQTAGYARQWWDALIKYVLYGPVVVFFLTLATRIGTPEGSRNPSFRTLSGQLGIEPTSDVAAFFLNNRFFGAMLEATFVVLFIVIALLAAQQMGVAGAAIGTAAARRWIPAATGGPALWTRTGKPFLEARAEAQKAITKERRAGFFGGLGARTAAPFSRRFAERQQLREVEESYKDMKARGVGKDETLRQLERGNVTQRAAAARYGVEKEYFDEPEQFERAKAAARGGDKEAVEKAYQKSRPVYATSGQPASAVKEALETGIGALSVKIGLRANAPAARRAFGRVKDEDLPKAKGEVKIAIEAATEAVRAGAPAERPIDLSVNKMRAIAERVPEAQQALDDYITALRATPAWNDATERQLRQRGIIT
ncbi:MAG: Uncharacterized protein G01um101438_635 [Parcubacteria group bacterium Gr01-1014_38]|nr:MAG: Uncharacterized protein G01um101438_635 [Parcubacteria group bacterium Gr01-1014_38]